MATAALDRKTSRIDLRMTDEQKRQIETAASLAGASISQWSLSHLLESAQQTITDQATVRLSEKSFDEFARALDQQANLVFTEFAQGKTRWEG